MGSQRRKSESFRHGLSGYGVGFFRCLVDDTTQSTDDNVTAPIEPEPACLATWPPTATTEAARPAAHHTGDETLHWLVPEHVTTVVAGEARPGEGGGGHGSLGELQDVVSVGLKGESPLRGVLEQHASFDSGELIVCKPDWDFEW
eukprot:CAMPEP_0175897384 /NCGR_PEP_ID=MMETSP0108-20121206/686_1 /TAXON_ID=195067 ORGANISM="Goniomonas pacifica, Strain CCMP1869" /NCGR_SAMPLE_ID=MMETSP0108 /ASSEMBLY_ACC=CAM_ASM_000204 /LENGTH=144 /DNA_ID=CAMNT_0017218669 /DNA_START=195 /DNA_END=626 /DNA_ORIENTATION=+